MGYTTKFAGHVAVDPPLSAREVDFLREFSATRRMQSTQGPYYVDRSRAFGRAGVRPDVLDHNHPPEGQPSLWCQWIPSNDGTRIEWDGSEKFSAADRWMRYLMDHFVGPTPAARSELPFLTGHHCSGEIRAIGEEGMRPIKYPVFAPLGPAVRDLGSVRHCGGRGIAAADLRAGLWEVPADGCYPADLLAAATDAGSAKQPAGEPA